MPPIEAMVRFQEIGEVPDKVRDFALKLMETTLANQETIDEQLTKALEHWKMSRLPAVIRNLLRLAVCEMIVMAESPFQVVVNEAVEMARQYMDEDSAKFVNGVLERCWLNDGRELPLERGAGPADLASLSPAGPVEQPPAPEASFSDPETEEESDSGNDPHQA